MDIISAVAAVRQRTFPAAFRIRTTEAGELPDLLAEHLEQMLISLDELERRLKQSTPQPQVKTARPSDEELAHRQEKSFAIGLSNECFRWLNNLDSLTKRLPDNPDLEDVRKRLANIRAFCRKKKGFEWADLQNEPYDLKRNDFEPTSEAEDTPGLDRPRILRCELPVVRLQGKIIQKARGIVGKPVGKTDNSRSTV